MLNSPDFQDIDRRYLVAQTKVKLITLVIEDLDKYKQAIEAGLVNYHQTKIREINQRISDLWATTYQGKDIESIEIVSNQVTRGTKTIFDYAVYMVKVVFV